MSLVYIGIGSNLGSRKENCEKAVNLLSRKGIKVLKCSSFYETEPWGIKEQPKFINAAVEAETDLKPEKLLKTIKGIESDLGRGSGIRWGPRLIDLDILLYNDLVVKTNNLEIPHPGVKNREFVLKPLSEIAPDKIHPVLKKSIESLFLECVESSEKNYR